MTTLAYVVSSHGFGHAARSAAVIESLVSAWPDVRVEILTTTPRWFFEQSLTVPFAWHGVTTDLGLVQANSLEEDLDATAARLEALLEDPDRLVSPIAERLESLRPDLVVCDISPWGLEAARRLSLPSVLVENFTWPWIYRGYGDPRLDAAADRLEPFFAADHRVRIEPWCGSLGDAARVAPVARRPRHRRREVRRRLGVPESAELAMVTMGGVPWSFGDFARQLRARASPRWLLVAGGADEVVRNERAVLIPHRSDFYHPDLVAASDLVVGKLGYSTLAEVSESGAAFLFVPRPRFRESPPLEAWALEHLRSRAFAPGDLVAPDWLARLDAALDALAEEPSRPRRGGGAGELAELLAGLLEA